MTLSDLVEDQSPSIRQLLNLRDVTLRYKITPIDSIRYQLTVVQGSPEYLRQRSSYYLGRGLWLALWAYALVISVVFVKSLPAALVLAGLLVFQLRQFLPFDSHLQRLFLERYGSAVVKQLELKVDSGGMTESEGDVIFFAPWSSVQRVAIKDDLLLIRIKSGQHIVISRHSLEPHNISLESVLEDISSRLQLSQGMGEAAFK